jgi:hypothetical protein
MMSVISPHPKSLAHFGRGTLKTPAPLSSLGEGLGVRANLRQEAVCPRRSP